MGSVVSMRLISSAGPAVKALSDQALLDLIHDGIPEEGMPSFPSIGQRRWSGGRRLYSLSARQVRWELRARRPGPGQGSFLRKGRMFSLSPDRRPRISSSLGDLAGFARDHPGNEIRDAILRPSGEQQETATAVGRDGRKFSGMIRNEDNASLQLQDGDGRFYLLMKSSLVSVQRKAERSHACRLRASAQWHGA